MVFIMSRQVRKPLIVLCILLVLIFTFMGIASQLQSDFGKVEVELITIEAVGLGDIAAKLYTPNSATKNSPAPAVLLLHGYQNDKDTCGAYSIELARRGFVVLAIDEYGHGSTTVGLIERGYVNHRVTVNFGEDSAEAGTFVEISGPTRFKVLMNFSNLSFFNEKYSRDSAGNSIKDSSMGGIAAYATLAGYDFVDETRMAVGGHSMGTWASWSVAAAYSGAVNNAGADISPKAIVLQCGEIFTDTVYDAKNIVFRNVLILQAKFEEFSMFRDYNNTVTAALPGSSLRSGFLGVQPAEARWDTTYGSMADGSARRMELLYTNHRLVTHNSRGIALAMDWYNGAVGNATPLSSSNQVYMAKEMLVFASMLLSLAAMLALMELLLNMPFFRYVRQAVPNRPERVKSGWAWWKGAIITMLVAAATYPFMTQLGHGLLPLPENIFRMTIGNGFMTWYLLLIIIMVITTVLPWKKSKKAGKPMDYYDLGFASEERADRFDWLLLGKSAVLATLMVGLVYILVTVSQGLFLLDFRVIWPFFRPYSWERLLQCLVYIPFFATFFVLNNSKIFAQMRQKATSVPGLRGFMACWWKNALCMAGGIFIICLIMYVPFFAGIGPGADLLFSPTFGGPFMSLLLVFFPQVVVLSILCTYIHRRTGNVFVSGLSVGILSCWIIAGGSAMM
jgi:hypothetical protein